MTSGNGNGQHDHDPKNGKPPGSQGAPLNDAAREQDQQANAEGQKESPELLAAQAERLVMNAYLDEVLGGMSPPDLAPRILARLALQNGNGHDSNGHASAAELALNGFHNNGNGKNGADKNGADKNGLAQAPRPVGDVSDIANDSGSGTHRRAPVAKSGAAEFDAAADQVAEAQSSNRGWLLAVAACAACLLLAFVTYLNWQSVFGSGANSGTETASGGSGENAQPAEPGQSSDQPRTNPSTTQGISDEDPNRTPVDGGFGRIANGSGFGGSPDNDRGPTSTNPEVLTAPRPVTAVVAGINEALERRWQEESVTPAAWATDAEWCRRVYLDLLGRIPTVEESVNYVTSSDSAKKEQLVERLLYGSEYGDELADHWAGVWTNILIGREGGTDPGSTVNREGLRQYLASAVSENKPYDGIVTDLVTATGSNRPGTPGFNGAVNFLLDNLDHDGASATAKTAQIFLARQIQCAQCHNHPFNDEPQKQFWELNAFFRQAQVVRGRGGNEDSQRGVVRLVDRNFAGEGNRRNTDEAEIYYERANGLLEMAFPRFLDGTAIDPSGRLAQVNRRQELARLIVQSPWMSEAIVNRMWSHFLGSGFSRPLDDLGPHQRVSHPELLQDLAGEFRAQKYDLRRLMQWIVLSKPYSLSSEAVAANASADQPLADGGPLFSRFYSRQLSPEAVYDSLLVAAGKHGREGAQEQNRARRLWLGQFTMELENDENREVDLFDGAIPQALEMWNGSLTSQALSLKDQGLLASIANSEMSQPEKIKHLFLAALSREPTSAEMRLVRSILREAGPERTPQALQDVYWSLLNSSEFILQH